MTNEEIIRIVRKANRTLIQTPEIQRDLFPTATKLRSIVMPLDQMMLQPSYSKVIAEALGKLDTSSNVRVLSQAIGSSAALNASRLGDLHGLQLASTRIADLYGLQSGLGALAQRWQRSLDSWTSGMHKFVLEQQRLDEQTDEFVKTHGWPVPLHIPVRIYRRIVELTPFGKRDVIRALQHYFRPRTRAFASVADVLLQSPQFQSRRPAVKQALAAHRRREWYLSISTLLPMVEGVLVDVAFATATPPDKNRPARAIRQLKKREGSTLDIAIATTETILLSAGGNVALFRSFDPARYNVPGEPRSLNRHAILHGAARRYGSEQNSLRLILLLAVMAEGFDLAD